MPLTAKGSKILEAFRKEYGAERGERYFYAAKNAGKITGVDAADMADGDWQGLLRGFFKWVMEERKEPEHAADCTEDEATEHARGALTEKEREEADRSHAEREDMPAEAFLEPAFRKYPVKEKRDGKYVYSRNLLLAAAREARMHGHEDLAKRADEIRAREFGSASDMALDRASERHYDADGRLHVDRSNISKANICEYFGNEIPEYERLGLDPQKKYRLLRDPKELEKAVGTFNSVPILSKHVPVSADSHPPELVIGSTGTDAQFEDPYLINSLVFWPQTAIDKIENGEQKQLSCAYRYRADMTPGEYGGQPYDGVMRDIVGNHVALVKEGRAGPDVLVGDSAIQETTPMAIRLSPGALVAKGAVLAHFPKLMAMDSATIDPVFQPVTGKNYPEKKAALALAIKGLAQDASLEEIHKLLDSLDKHEKEAADTEANSGVPVAHETAPDESPEEKKRREDEEDRLWEERATEAHDRLGRDESEEEREKRESEQSAEDARKRLGRDEEPKEREEREARDKMGRDRRRTARDAKRAHDEPPDFKGMPKVGGEPMVTKKAMDEAIGAAVTGARKVERDIREAITVVRPWVGDLSMAFDSAEAVFQKALEIRGVKIDGIHPSAYRAILEAQPKPGREQRHEPVLAADTAGAKSFAEMFPGAANIRISA